MVAFPLAATLISLACAAVIGRDALRRPRPEKLAWTVAFATFAVAAGAEAIAVAGEWTPGLVRVFYLTGAVLVVGYLGLGELYLLMPRRMERLKIVPGLAILVSALGATLVWSAPIDEGLLAEDGWRAMERGPALVALVALCSGLGTVIIVGGALWSAWRFRRLGIHRHRMIGCVLIAVGTLTVAVKGTLGRTGLPEETFVIAMAVGVGIIFAGYLETRRSDAPRSLLTTERLPAPAIAGASTTFPASNGAGPGEAENGRRTPPVTISSDPAIRFIEERFLPLAETSLTQRCRVWSVPRSEADAFDREEARRVWAFRLRLTPGGQARFDELHHEVQLQVATLYAEVLSYQPAPVESPVASRR